MQHLKVDTRTILENKCLALDGTDCSHIGFPSSLMQQGTVSRTMLGSVQLANDPCPADARPRANYYRQRHESDLFLDPSLLDPIDLDQHNDIQSSIDAMLEKAFESGLPTHAHALLKKTVTDYMDIFRTSLSSGPPAKLPPLKISLTTDAEPVRVRLRNYSQDQRKFLSNFVDKLVDHGMAYPNPTAAWASAPLLVPKPDPARYRFTVELRLVNKYTVRHHYPMPNLEQ